MRYALIENNIVKDIFNCPEGTTIEECFHPDIVNQYIPCPNINIIEGDLYDSEAQNFTENPNKKYPNYSEWYEALKNTQNAISEYFDSLNPIINNFTMYYQNLQKYKSVLSLVLSGVDDVIEIDGHQFNGDEFKLMIDSLKEFQKNKGDAHRNHLITINSFNSAEELSSYDFTTEWPEINISI